MPLPVGTRARVGRLEWPANRSTLTGNALLGREQVHLLFPGRCAWRAANRFGSKHAGKSTRGWNGRSQSLPIIIRPPCESPVNLHGNSIDRSFFHTFLSVSKPLVPIRDDIRFAQKLRTRYRVISYVVGDILPNKLYSRANMCPRVKILTEWILQ